MKIKIYQILFIAAVTGLSYSAQADVFCKNKNHQIAIQLNAPTEALMQIDQDTLQHTVIKKTSEFISLSLVDVETLKMTTVQFMNSSLQRKIKNTVVIYSSLEISNGPGSPTLTEKIKCRMTDSSRLKFLELETNAHW